MPGFWAGGALVATRPSLELSVIGGGVRGTWQSMADNGPQGWIEGPVRWHGRVEGCGGGGGIFSGGGGWAPEYTLLGRSYLRFVYGA